MIRAAVHALAAFLADERGAETTELAITSVVVTGGAAAKYRAMLDKVGEKIDDAVALLDAVG